jgi:hypothetical protein
MDQASETGSVIISGHESSQIKEDFYRDNEHFDLGCES